VRLPRREREGDQKTAGELAPHRHSIRRERQGDRDRTSGVVGAGQTDAGSLPGASAKGTDHHSFNQRPRINSPSNTPSGVAPLTRQCAHPKNSNQADPPHPPPHPPLRLPNTGCTQWPQRGSGSATAPPTPGAAAWRAPPRAAARRARRPATAGWRGRCGRTPPTPTG